MTCHHCRRRIPATQSYWTVEAGDRRGAVYCSRRCAHDAEEGEK